MLPRLLAATVTTVAATTLEQYWYNEPGLVLARPFRVSWRARNLTTLQPLFMSRHLFLMADRAFKTVATPGGWAGADPQLLFLAGTNEGLCVDFRGSAVTP